MVVALTMNVSILSLHGLSDHVEILYTSVRMKVVRQVTQVGETEMQKYLKEHTAEGAFEYE